jgi:hypothetical protein
MDQSEPWSPPVSLSTDESLIKSEADLDVSILAWALHTTNT